MNYCPTIGSCGPCRFWIQSKPEKDPEYGTCVRFPPKRYGDQPLTWRSTVCGEWQE